MANTAQSCAAALGKGIGENSELHCVGNLSMPKSSKVMRVENIQITYHVLYFNTAHKIFVLVWRCRLWRLR